MKKKRFFALFVCLSCIVTTLFPTIAFADAFSNDKLNNCYLDVMNEYNNNSDNAIFDYDDEYFDIAMESNEINGKLINYI